MKVISHNPIIFTSTAGSERSANFNGKEKKQSQPIPDGYSIDSPTGSKEKGKLWNKVKGTWENSSDVIKKAAGFTEKLNNVLTTANSFTNTSDTTAPIPEPYIEEDDKKMSKGLKIGLIVGGAVITTVVIILIVRANKK